jgi:Ankyrin repeats (3 copies)
MHHSLSSLFIDAFGTAIPLKDAKLTRRALHTRRRRAQLTLVQWISALALVLLMAANASAQEVDPKFTFSKPSDEMDFTLPPLQSVPDGLQEKKEGELPPDPSMTPPIYGFDTPPPLPTPALDGEKANDDAMIDQFFSTTTILTPDESPSEEVEPVAEKEKPTSKKKKIARPRIAPEDMYPAHEFKSVHLPSTIYHKDYSRDNKGLPFAYMEDDQQQMLAEAAKRDDIDTARSLWRNGARLDWRDAKDTPLLTIAVQHHSENVTRWLLMKGVNANDVDGAGLSPLHYAAYAGNHETVDLLLSYGADHNLADVRGKTPLMYAKLHPASNIVQRMLAF